MLLANAKPRSPDPLKFDPSRTLGLRRSFAAEFVRRLELLRGDIVRLLIVEDAFSLSDPTFNFNPYHEPAGSREGGRFASADTGGGSVDVRDAYSNDALSETKEKVASEALGVNRHNVHALLGVPPDAKVILSFEHSKTSTLAHIEIRGHDPQAGDYLLKRKYVVEREVPGYMTSRNDKFIANDVFEVQNKGTGFGMEVFSRQVQESSAAGFPRIETFASGQLGKLNGYYTWPRLGYDGSLKNTYLSGKPILDDPWIKEKGYTKVSDLMKTKEGRDWWKEKGSSFDATFDLKEGSLSRRVLDAYVQEKKNRTAPTTNEGGRGDTRLGVGLVGNVQWKFATTEQQLKAFQGWLDEQIKRRLLTTDEVDRIWTQRYINAAYKKGIIRGETQTARLRRKQFTSFLRDTAKQRRKTELLIRRSLNDVEGLANRVKTNAARVVADGLANGKTKRQIAKELSDQLGIEKNRARTIARTEVVRAQAEGQLDAYEAEGVTHVGALVEWVTRAGRGASEAEMQAAGVCPKCQAMSGVVLTVQEARGLIPRHPNCYCAWFPALDTPDPDEKRSKLQIQRAISRSARKDKGKGWAGTQKQFKSKTRKARKRR